MAAASTHSTPSTMNPKKRKFEKEDDEESKHWPEDVIQEILVRFPIKSILRFKSTSKKWYSLIQSRHFIEFHRQFQLLNREDHRNRIFISNGTRKKYSKRDAVVISTLSPSFSSQSQSELIPLYNLGRLPNHLSRFDTVLGPLNNGIYCILAQDRRISNTGNPQSFLKSAFCNPATREFKLISHSPVISCNAIFNLHSILYGFGTIHKIGRSHQQIVVDYKIIVVNQVEFIAYLYSLQQRSWKRISDGYMLHFPTINPQLGLSQAFLNGSCHWPNQYSILRFDMVNEVFGLIAAPPDEYNQTPVSRKSMGVFVLNDRLAVIISVRPGDFLQNIDVWVMMDYGFEKSWTKIHSCEFVLKGLILGKFLGISFSSSEKDCNGFSVIERLYFEDGTREIVISCDRSGYQKMNCNFWSNFACWKTLGLSGYVDTLERVDLEVEDMDEEGNNS